MASGKTWEDADFMPEIAGVSRRGAHRLAHLLLVVIIVFFAVFYVWARQATLDEVTRGDGTVIPSGQIQTVQNLEGGIVSAILVHEGDTVDKGQVLLKIDNTSAASDYHETRARYLSVSAVVSRLEAEVAGKNDVTFSKDVLDEAPEVARREEALFQSRRAGLNAELDILRRQTDPRRSREAPHPPPSPLSAGERGCGPHQFKGRTCPNSIRRSCRRHDGRAASIRLP